jgi:hypothetical protein
MLRVLMLVALAIQVTACTSAPARPTPAAPQATPTTIVVIVTVPPIPTSSPTPIVAPLASPNVGPDRVLTLTSDGTSTPPRFTLAGGDYLFSWVVVRPTDERGCTFGALLTPEPSVSPPTVQALGPLTILPNGGLSGSKQLVGLGPGGYTLRPSGDCRWTVTVTPLQGR